MSYYYNSITQETKIIDDDIYISWINNSNPKANSYKLIADPPNYNAHYDGTAWKTYEPTLEQIRSGMVVTPRQANLALLASGLLETVENWINTQSKAIQIDWTKATEIRRDWPVIEQAKIALGLTEEQIDDLFTLAETL